MLFVKPTVLKINSTETHIAVYDGPPTRRASVLDAMLDARYDYNTLPPGEYEGRFKRVGWTLIAQLTKVD